MNKKVQIIIAAIGVVIVIMVVVLLVSQKNKQSSIDTTKIPEKMLEDQTPEAAKATQELISEVTAAASSTVEGAKGGAQTIEIVKPGADASSSETIKAVVVSPGTSPINVETGKVVTRTGDVAVNNVEAGSQSGPKQSFELDLSKTVVPTTAIKLNVKQDSFSPSEFTVNRGQLVSLFVTNVNDGPNYEIFMFDDASLEAVAVGILTGQTKSISFNAPTKAGEYTFYSAQLNHRALGAVGKMIVK